MVRSIMGLQEVRSQLLSLERRAVIAADGALEMAAGEIVSRAQSYAPERTGELRRSIEKRSISRRRKAVVVGAWYAPFVEFGRRGMSPRPFLRPAIDALGRRVMDRVAAKIHVDLQSMRLNRTISV
jgi:HK97 gp10 family phage protein